MLFSPTVRGFRCPLQSTKRFVVTSVVVAPQDSQICGGNFPKRNKSAAELSQILRIVTIKIVLNSTHLVAYARDYVLPVLHCLGGDAFVSSQRENFSQIRRLMGSGMTLTILQRLFSANQKLSEFGGNRQLPAGPVHLVIPCVL